MGHIWLWSLPTCMLVSNLLKSLVQKSIPNFGMRGDVVPVDALATPLKKQVADLRPRIQQYNNDYPVTQTPSIKEKNLLDILTGAPIISTDLFL